MKKQYPIPAGTAESQARASDPRTSAWVSANAGSGKTHVLAQRVIRLLLRGIDPSKILCLTYTRAAAANMSNCVFSTLSDGPFCRMPNCRRGSRRSMSARLMVRPCAGRAGCSPRRWKRRAG